MTRRSEGRWHITVTAPDWGQDHLSSDAIVAFVDDELASGPHLRATQHLAQCRECAAQVVAQGQARSALRAADCPSLPSSLLNSLRSIPQNAELTPPPAGLAVTADGQFVTVLRDDDDPHGSQARADIAASGPAGASSDHGRRPPGHRRMRLGTGVAVSGLALGALALGAPSASTGPGTPTPAADLSAFRGSLLNAPSGVVDARLRIVPTTTPVSSADPVTARLEQLPGSFLRLR